MKIFKKVLKTSVVGPLTLYANSHALIGVCWQNEEFLINLDDELVNKENEILKKSAIQLQEYFDKKRRTFDLPLEFVRGTEFQKTVWKALKKVSHGRTLSYKDLALKIGDTNKARPVGGAVGKNPIPIIVPCHRIIGSQGSLTGFASGIENKKRLLEIEGIQF